MSNWSLHLSLPPSSKKHGLWAYCLQQQFCWPFRSWPAGAATWSKQAVAHLGSIDDSTHALYHVTWNLLRFLDELRPDRELLQVEFEDVISLHTWVWGAYALHTHSLRMKTHPHFNGPIVVFSHLHFAGLPMTTQHNEQRGAKGPYLDQQVIPNDTLHTNTC